MCGLGCFGLFPVVNILDECLTLSHSLHLDGTLTISRIRFSSMETGSSKSTKRGAFMLPLNPDRN